MPCGCGKKTSGTVHFMGKESADVPDPIEWGPVVWKYLHCLSEKLGISENPIVTADQANYMETIVSTIHLIIPCPECQAHAAEYLSAYPFPTLKTLTGEVLRSAARNWLYSFHNAVRNRKGQTIMINTPEECAQTYANCFVPKCEYNLFIQNVAYAVRQGWVRVENWRKWYSTSEKLRIISGNVVV